MHNTIVVPSGTSQYLTANSKKAVLCLHGYTGFPYDMKYIAGHIHSEGYTVHVPRLPGHATDINDFLATNAHDWFTRAKNAYLDLAAVYDEVIVLGFSMGGIISLILASMFPIEKLILIAPAVLVHNKNLKYTPLIWPFVRKIKSNPLCNGQSDDHKYLFDEYWQWGYPKNIAQFYKLQKQGRRILPKVTADALIIVSEKDETVPVEASELIKRKSSCKSIESVVLQNSPHVMLDGQAPEKETVKKHVLQWLQKKSAGTN